MVAKHATEVQRNAALAVVFGEQEVADLHVLHLVAFPLRLELGVLVNVVVAVLLRLYHDICRLRIIEHGPVPRHSAIGPGSFLTGVVDSRILSLSIQLLLFENIVDCLTYQLILGGVRIIILLTSLLYTAFMVDSFAIKWLVAVLARSPVLVLTGFFVEFERIRPHLTSLQVVVGLIVRATLNGSRFVEVGPVRGAIIDHVVEVELQYFGLLEDISSELAEGSFIRFFAFEAVHLEVIIFMKFK